MAIGTWFYAAITCFAAYQGIGLISSDRLGNPLKISSCGLVHVYRCLLVLLQTLLFIVLYATNPVSISAISAASILVILSLHVIEPTRSPHQLASVLFYWIGQIVLLSVSFTQDLCSPVKILAASNLGLGLEAILLVNSLLIFVLETIFWLPSAELVDHYYLNDWDMKTIRNILSHWTFNWMHKFVSHTFWFDGIYINDLPQIPKQSTCDVAYKQIHDRWQKQVKSRRNPLVFLAILSEFKYAIFIGTCYNIVTTILSLLQPIILQKIIQFFTTYLHKSEEPRPPFIVVYFYANLMLTVMITNVIVSNQSTSFRRRAGFVIQSSLTSMIYHKTVRISSHVNKSAGQIISHASMDVAFARNCMEYLQNFIEANIQFMLCIVPLYSFLQDAIWPTLIASLFLIVLSVFIEFSLIPVFRNLLVYRDERVSIINQILSSIKSIKLFAWEVPMMSKINQLRSKKELKSIREIGIIHSVVKFLWSCIPFMIIIIGFSTYIYIYESSLTPEIVFPTLSLLNNLVKPISEIPRLMVYSIQAKRSFDRLGAFFLMDEIHDTVIRSNEKLTIGDTCISIKNSSFLWKIPKHAGHDSQSIRNIALTINDFQVRKGQLICLVGKIGSGKTTLLRSLLGELEIIPNSPDSYVKVNGSIAYCCQDPWIQNISIRENILFGCKYDVRFYWKIIEACELRSCFEALPENDLSIVGEGGTLLSGGQRARISLARAIYSRSDIYLFDDILASVDINIGKQIANNILGKNGLLSGKTVILATSSISILEKASEIVFLKNGAIKEINDNRSIYDNQSELFELVTELNTEIPLEAQVEMNETDIETTPTLTATNSRKIDDLINDSEDVQSDESIPDSIYDDEDLSIQDSIYEYDEDNDDELIQCIDNTLVPYNSATVDLEQVYTRDTMTARKSIASFDHTFENYHDNESGISGFVRRTFQNIEKASMGKIKRDVLIEFFKACKIRNIVIYVILAMVVVILNSLRNYSLTYFTYLDNSKHVNKTNLKIFFTLGMLECLVQLIASYQVWSMCIVPGVSKVHEKFLKSVLYSSMNFFDLTPNGRIMNRFTNDIRHLDKKLPLKLTDFTTLVLNLTATVVMIIYSIPMMAIPIALLSIVYNLIRLYFLPISRELQRLIGVLSSPIISHIEESIHGLEIIRSYDQNERFVYKNHRNIDNLTRVMLIQSSSNRWLAIRLEAVSSLVTYLSIILAIVSLETNKPVSPPYLGLIISYSLALTGTLDTTVTVNTELEAELITIERIVEYFSLKPEVNESEEKNKMTFEQNWPSSGKIRFRGFNAKYEGTQDLVLKNINLMIQPGERISIVGKTGSGKSTLTLSIFRMIQRMTGSIEIDDINIEDIQLYELRKRLNIIPQGNQPIIGTTRQILDPLNQITNDEELWTALTLVNMKNHIINILAKTDSPKQSILDVEISRHGNLLSVGQNQLLSLARALLNPSKILILDEATSYIDVATVRTIRETIKSHFKESTILTIAHRFETIMDSDKVLMLEHGEIIEFDNPNRLLKDDSSRFSSFCKNGFST